MSNRLQRFRGQTSEDQLYRCKGCGDLIRTGLVFDRDEEPYHDGCLPNQEPELSEDEGNPKAERVPFAFAYATFCGLSVAVILTSIILRLTTGQTHAGMVMAALLTFCLWLIVTIARK